MRLLNDLFERNRRWAEGMRNADPEFFTRLAAQQSPRYLWIGCSDSRVPANQITGLDPGEVFVHRNVANVVIHTDLNLLSVLQYAVEVLEVEHVIVCGHYGCGGVQAAMQSRPFGLIDNWLRNIKDVYTRHDAELAGLDERERFARLCELNVRHQVANVCYTTIVQRAWHEGRRLAVHGWIYTLDDGLLRDLAMTVDGPEKIPRPYRLDLVGEDGGGGPEDGNRGEV